MKTISTTRVDDGLVKKILLNYLKKDECLCLSIDSVTKGVTPIKVSMDVLGNLSISIMLYTKPAQTTNIRSLRTSAPIVA